MTSMGIFVGRLHAGAVVAVAVVGVLARPAAGQTASPAPSAPAPSSSPVPTTAPFSARAHVDVSVAGQGRTMTGAVQLGMAQRANLTRIDVLSVKSDTLPVPPVSVTVVIDRRANTVAAWSDTTKLYHVQPFIPRPPASPSPKASPTPAPRTSPSPQPARGSPFAGLDVLSLTIKLIGHTMTQGIPTTGLSFDLQVAKKGETVPTHVSATTQLADEYAAFPLTLDVAVEPGGAMPFKANLAYAVDQITRDDPPASRFEIPRGYADAGSLLGVVFPRSTSAARPSKTPPPR
jgi:hypothetical protein